MTRVDAQYTKHGRAVRNSKGETVTDQGRYYITVTQEDIDAACQNNSHHCAVATAIKSSVEPSYHPDVTLQTIRFSRLDTGLRYVFLTPRAVQEYIAAFDAGEPIEPFTFVLQHPAYCGARTTRKGPGAKIDYTTKLDAGRTVENRKVIKVRATPPVSHGKRREFGMRALRINGGRSAAV